MGMVLFQASLQLYPTVGLQTPGEIVEGNFGEDPFMFDFRALLTVSVSVIDFRALLTVSVSVIVLYNDLQSAPSLSVC